MVNSYRIRSVQIVGVLWIAAIVMLVVFPIQHTNKVTSLIGFTIIVVVSGVAAWSIRKVQTKSSCLAMYGQRLLQFAEKCQQAATATEIVSLLRDEMKELLPKTNVSILIYDKQQNDFQKLPPLLDRKWLESVSPGQWKRTKDHWIMSVGEGLQEQYYLYGEGSAVARPSDAAEQYFTLLACHVQLLLHNRLLVHSDVDKLIHTHTAASIHSSPLVSQMLFSIAEAERKKLSHDIHDYLIQELIHMNRIIEQHRQVHPDMRQLHCQMQNNIGYLRERCFDLSPPFLQQLSVAESLNMLIDQHRSQNRCDIEFICRVNTDATFSEVFNINIYRIAQELLNNAAKHAQAESIVVSLLQKEDKMVLVYEDNGIGINWEEVNEKKNHFGLTGIKERIKSMNGTHVIVSNINEGLLFKCEFPRDSYTS